MFTSRPCVPASLALAAIVLHPVATLAQTRAADTPSTTGTAAPAAAAPATTGQLIVGWKEEEYRLGPGDKLRVEVFEQDQLSQSVQIRPDGKITLPFVGDIVAAGQTSLELRDALAALLKEFVISPVVTVIVQEAVSAQVCIIGEVRTPGCQVMNGPTTVLQALSRAGDVTEFANRGGIRILRQTGTRQEAIRFDYRNALRGETAPVYLQPGDQVVVP